MSRGLTKAERLQEMIWLYLQRAYSDIEMAERLGVDRTTVFRDRIELTAEHAFRQEQDGRYRLDRMQYMPNIKLNLNEALSLYLAARRTSRQTRISQPYAASALEKLAIALKQPMTERLVRSAGEILKQETDPDRLRVLEVITQGWAENRKVRIQYQGLRARSLREHLVSPYLIEPSLWTDGVYLIGYSDARSAITTFKVERIEEAELKLERFEQPVDFDEEELLRYAWGIWSSEAAPETVRLKFRPGPTSRRLLESKWHPTEKITKQEDGNLLWEAQVAEWQEMVPWVRGWGADVEVLEPEEMREHLIKECFRLTKVYSITPEERQKEWFLWAKAEGSTNQVHSLIYHMIDVGQVALSLWDIAFPPQTRQLFSEWLKLDDQSTGRLLAFWASLHDIGKSSPSFQRKFEPALRDLKKAGFSFQTPSVQPAKHGLITTWALRTLLADIHKIDPFSVLQVARALGGHHGAWPTAAELTPRSIQPCDYGDTIWNDARKTLLKLMQGVFEPPADFDFPPDVENQNALLALISGLTSAADWIGSMENFFPYCDGAFSPEEYKIRSSRQAKEALASLGWLGWKPKGETITFDKMFPGFIPNSIQQTIIDNAAALIPPSLAIIEAPTGSGKTEAAFFLSDTWVQSSQGRGLYIAMPTQATSNQMYTRLADFLVHRYPETAINLHLVHGAALLADIETAPAQIVDDETSENIGSIQASSWFFPRKRTFLAPFGIGTVDQALMAVLQTRHFFVRLFGLGQKVVVFDEIHAYDTYMSVLFRRLLRWLRSIGTSVVLLSATLPNQTRRELINSWAGFEQTEDQKLEYPRLTMISDAKINTISLPPPPTYTLDLNQIDPDPNSIIEYLKSSLADGGCAAIICNRVKRAQELYIALKQAHIVPAEDLMLLHARFPFAWREEIEKRVLSLFSPHGDRPKKSILVATQVIEQSLDLDFDLMITDYAPVDLLLQRAGRLHRHRKNDGDRPSQLKDRNLVIINPHIEDGVPHFGLDEYVYDRSILLRTWATLNDRNHISIPSQTAELIETVYAQTFELEGIDPRLLDIIHDADERFRMEREKQTNEAKMRLVADPGDEDLLSDPNQNLDEDDPKIHQAFRALTRLSDPNVQIVCLHSTENGLSLDQNGPSFPINIQKRPSVEQTKELLRHSLTIQNWEVVRWFWGQPAHPAWKEVAALRYHFPVVFDREGQCRLDRSSLVLTLNLELGLEIRKEEK